MDPAVLTRAQRGDARAQTAFQREVGPVVAALVRRLGKRRDVEDQLHGIFTHLLGVLPRFDPAGPARLSTWVHTVAHRWLLMQRRKTTPVLVALDGGLATAQPDAAEYTLGRQLSGLLERALAELPEEQRRVFVLTQLHQQPLEEVALVEGVPVGTIKSRLHRARAALVLRLGPALDRTAEGGDHAAP